MLTLSRAITIVFCSVRLRGAELYFVIHLTLKFNLAAEDATSASLPWPEEEEKASSALSSLGEGVERW